MFSVDNAVGLVLDVFSWQLCRRLFNPISWAASRTRSKSGYYMQTVYMSSSSIALPSQPWRNKFSVAINTGTVSFVIRKRCETHVSVSLWALLVPRNSHRGCTFCFVNLFRVFYLHYGTNCVWCFNCRQHCDNYRAFRNRTPSISRLEV